MTVERARTRDRSTWPILVGLFLLAVGSGTAAYLRWPSASHRVPPPAASSSKVEAIVAPTPIVRQEPAPQAEPISPTFDIVRVSPQGSAVIAGRAEPFSHVVVHDGDHVLGETTADRNGEFVVVPDGPVSTGGRELTLTARGADGQVVSGLDSVVLMVGAPPVEPVVAEAKPAGPPAAVEAPVAVLLPHNDAAPRILQGPAKPQGLALNSVDYDQQGEIRFSGSAKPSAPVRVYVDNKPVGEASADTAGQWTLTPPEAVQPGVHQLRVDEIASSGQVQHRVELPFQRTVTPVSGLSPGQMVVQPGSNLWRIARQTYGSGARYTVIYLANREHIRDPNRIYPGQIFSIPGEQSAQTR